MNVCFSMKRSDQERTEKWHTYEKNRAALILEEALKQIKSLDPDDVTDKHITILAEASSHALEQGLPTLTKIKLTNYENITDKSIRKLLLCYPTLQSITLASCKIGNKTIAYLAKHCPLLENIVLVGFKTIDNIGITAIAAYCSKLKNLNIADCANVSDEALIELALHCPLLEKVNLFANQKVTAIGIKALLFGCKNLKEVEIYQCTKISSTEITALEREYPGIIISKLKSLKFT